MVGLLSMEGTLVAGTLEEKQHIAQRQFSYVPGAEWAVLEQPFWKHHVVFKLVKSTDPRFSHRPKVAVDEQNKPHLLTDGILKISHESVLKEFNRAAQSEAVQITADNVEEYVRFFWNVHLGYSDALRLIGKDTVDRVLKLPPHSDEAQRLQEAGLERQGQPHVAIASINGGFHATVFAWNSQGGWVVQHDFTIHPDGTVALEGTKFRQPPEAASTGPHTR